MDFREAVKEIKFSGSSIQKDAQSKIDGKTKPPGSLGMVEDIAVKMSMIQNNLNPVISMKRMFVFAGDHGIAEEGVSAFPAEVTPQMVLNFLNGGAAINVFCKQAGIDINIIDMGVNFEFEKGQEKLINKKVNMGTSNFVKGNAMSENEAIQAIQNGFDVFSKIYESENFDIIGLGDMGIANTTSSSAIISVVTGVSPEKTTGRGTGIDDEGLKNKISIISSALEMHKPDSKDPLDILQKVGGFEIAGIAGAILAAAYYNVAIVIDGIISTAGALIAYLFNKDVMHYMFAGHRSVEIGQTAALEMLQLKPILDLEMRLGEGTGAALAMNIIYNACCILTDMASFEKAGVSNKDE